MSAPRILLLGYPVHLGARHQEHLDEVTREFMLLTLSRPEVRSQVPGRLLELMDEITARLGEGLDEPRRRREEALERGETTVDLAYPLVAREIVTTWWATMREVDDYCRTDDLLALATPPDVVELQAWVVEEFLRQLDGHPPTPWPGR